MNRVILFVSFLASVVMLNACSREDIPEPIRLPDPTIEETEGGCTISFSMPYVPESLMHNKRIDIKLYPLEGALVEWNFSALISVFSSYSTVAIDVLYEHTSGPLNDGKYLYFMEDGYKSVEYILSIEDMRVTDLVERYNYHSKLYSVEGLGTEASPFLIDDESKFLEVATILKDDSLHGFNVFFKQTADLVLSPSDRGWQNVPFAGHYSAKGDDGNVYSISNINYDGMGAGTTHAGLFSELLNGATFSDVSLKGVFNSISGTDAERGTCGLLASTSSGTVAVSNCTIDISVSQSENSYIGGLIGHVKSGDLSINNITINNVNITGSTSSTGGVIGHISNDARVVIDRVVKEQDAVVWLKGKVDVGGVVGYIDNSRVDIGNVYIYHVVDQENKGTKWIYASQSGVGGVVGCVRGGSVDIHDSTIILTVGDMNTVYSGGLVGYCDSTLRVGRNTVSVYAEGSYVGGLVGEATNAEIYDEIWVAPRFGDYAAICGGAYVGGLFGKVSNLTIVDGTYQLVMATSVMAIDGNFSREYVGGIAGYISNSDVNLGPLIMGEGGDSVITSTLYIQGNKYVGGLFGKMSSTTLHGKKKNIFNYDEGAGVIVPSKSRFEPDVNYKVSADAYAGGVVGEMSDNSNLYNVCSKAVLANCNDRIGGLVGSASKSGRIEDCVYLGTEVSAGMSIGGICGYVDGGVHFQDCINYGKITGGVYAGGIVGYASWWDTHTYFNWCVNCGDVSGTTCVGGIVAYYDTEDEWSVNNGNNYFVTIAENSANYGAISATSTYSKDKDVPRYASIGGIVGAADNTKSKIYRCVNHGCVDGGNSMFYGIGGIVGLIGNDPTISEDNNALVYECANYGIIKSSAGDTNIGGIVGYLEEGWNDTGDSCIHDSYNSGEIDGGDDDGGIVGYFDRYAMLKGVVNFGQVKNGGKVVYGDTKPAGQNYTTSVFYVAGTGSTEDQDADEVPDADKNNVSAFGFETSKWKSGKDHIILINTPFQEVSYME